MNRPHDGIFKALKICLLTVTCIGSLSFCNSRIFSPSSVRGVSQKSNDPPKLVWISLDALNAEILKPYLDRFKSSHPRGLKWLLSQPNGNLGLKVGYPSITAPSHISTMTCARPGAHGVFLNAGNWNGT
ncbi:MAG: alkaline phosphatase family protein, partial [Proteobacteria bacterium]|nr:alkaline phosphatase family protein [Pseudomonadota bacterium]